MVIILLLVTEQVDHRSLQLSIVVNHLANLLCGPDQGPTPNQIASRSMLRLEHQYQSVAGRVVMRALGVLGLGVPNASQFVPFRQRNAKMVR